MIKHYNNCFEFFHSILMFVLTLSLETIFYRSFYEILVKPTLWIKMRDTNVLAMNRSKELKIFLSGSWIAYSIDGMTDDDFTPVSLNKLVPIITY